MPGIPPAPPPPSGLHGDAAAPPLPCGPLSDALAPPTPSGLHGDAEAEVMDAWLFPDVSPFTSTPLQLEEEEEQEEQQEEHQEEELEEEEEVSWSQDGDLQTCGQLERRWLLWHDFMREHAHLESWLRLAEQAVSSSSSAHVTRVTAREELRRFERLQVESGSQLVRLDLLTQKNRTLTRLFAGTMRSRLLTAARESGRRWDQVQEELETRRSQLKLLLSEWEGFEVEWAELTLWLSDLDVRLSDVDHLTGNTCEKLRRLQSFQQCVCVNSGRVNALLQRGEALIQRSAAPDAQRVERRLLELLRHCSLVYSNIARTHTRLLSMRLVFEDDWILPQASDSGCPSESLLEEEGLDKLHLDAAVTSHPAKDPSSTVHLLPAPPPSSPSSPTHEHLGLEWDPSVDIGRSVSPDDADSSYYSVSTGVCRRGGGVKRRSYLSSFGSQSDISNDIIKQEEETTGLGGGTWLSADQWEASTPDGQEGEPVSFDGGRVRAWLRVLSPAPSETTTATTTTTSCSRAVQTDGEEEDENNTDELNTQRCHDDPERQQQQAPSPAPFLSRDPQASSDWTNHATLSHPQTSEEEGEEEEEQQEEEEEARCPDELKRIVSSTSRTSSSSCLSPLLYLLLLLAAALLLLIALTLVVMEPPCHRSNRMPRTLHLALRYVNGPPPT